MQIRTFLRIWLIYSLPFFNLLFFCISLICKSNFWSRFQRRPNWFKFIQEPFDQNYSSHWDLKTKSATKFGHSNAVCIFLALRIPFRTDGPRHPVMVSYWIKTRPDTRQKSFAVIVSARRKNALRADGLTHPLIESWPWALGSYINRDVPNGSQSDKMTWPTLSVI